MLNGYLVNEEAEHLAARAAREAGAKREDQIRRAFTLILNRPPQPGELDRFASFNGSVAAIARVLFNSNEFLYTE